MLAGAACCKDDSVISTDLRADIETVTEICMDFIHSHISEVLESEDLVCLNSDTVISILGTADDVSTLTVLQSAGVFCTILGVSKS